MKVVEIVLVVAPDVKVLFPYGGRVEPVEVKVLLLTKGGRVENVGTELLGSNVKVVPLNVEKVKLKLSWELDVTLIVVEIPEALGTDPVRVLSEAEIVSDP